MTTTGSDPAQKTILGHPIGVYVPMRMRCTEDETKLAPLRFGAMLMGAWYLANAWANNIGGVGAAYLESLGPKSLFMVIAAALSAAGLVLALCVPWLRKQMGPIH